MKIKIGSLALCLFTSVLVLGQPYVPPDIYDETYSRHYGYQENLGQLFKTDVKKAGEVLYYTENVTPAVFVQEQQFSIVNYMPFDTINQLDSSIRLDVSWSGDNVSHSISPEAISDRDDYLTYHLSQVGYIPPVELAERIVYEDIYPKIDFHLFSNHWGLKACYVVRPGGDPNDITMKFDGQDSIIPLFAGSLRFWLDQKNIELPSLLAYEVDGSNNMTTVSWLPSYYKIGNGQIKVNTGAISSQKTLVLLLGAPESSMKIAPGNDGSSAGNSAIRSGGNNGNIDWSTYIKGNKINTSFETITDDDGNVYIVGVAEHMQFPSSPGVNTVFQTEAEGSTDATVIKFDSNGVRVWGTYYGGPSPETSTVIALKSEGQIVISGNTRHKTSTSTIPIPYPQPASAYQDTSIKTSTGIGTDVFIAELSGDAQSLIWATYFGGVGEERHANIDIDNSDNLYLACVGDQNSPSLFKSGAYNDGTSDGPTIARFKSNRSLYWCTHFPLNFDGEIYALDTDDEGYLYIAGDASQHLPIVDPGGNAYIDSSLVDSLGTSHGFFSRFDKNTQDLTWSTYFSGIGSSRIWDIEGRTHNEDPITTLYLIGRTNTPDLPFTNPGNGAHFDTTMFPNVASDHFIATVSSDNGLTWCTLLGGDAEEYSASMTFGKKEQLYGPGQLIVAGNIGPSYINVQFDCKPIPFWYMDSANAAVKENYLAIFDENHVYTYGTLLGGNGIEKSPSVAVAGNYLYYSATTHSSTTFGSEIYPLESLGGNSWYDAVKPSQLDGAGVITRFDLNFSEPADTSTSIIEIAPSGAYFSIYPNPAYNEVTIHFKHKTIIPNNLFVYSIHGQIVLTSSVWNNSPIDISKLESGMYIFQIGQQTEKLVIR